MLCICDAVQARVQDIETKPSPLEKIVAEQNQVASDLKTMEEDIIELAKEKKV